MNQQRGVSGAARDSERETIRRRDADRAAYRDKIAQRNEIAHERAGTHGYGQKAQQRFARELEQDAMFE